MRTPITRIEKAVGAFLIGVAALLVVALLGAARRLDLSDLLHEGFVLYAVAPESYGAAVGSPVRLHGIEVGSVTALALVDDPAHPDDPVRITIRLQDRAASFLHDRTVAVILEPPMGAGMPPFGTAIIELRTAGDRPLPRLAVVPAEGQDSMAKGMATMVGEMKAMREQLVHLTTDMNETFAGIRHVTDALGERKGMAGRIINDEQLGKDLEALLVEARGATADTRKVLLGVQGLADKSSAVVDDAHDISRSGKQLMTKVDSAVDVLPRLLASMERTLAASEELVKSLRGTASFAPELVRKVDLSLDETNRLVEAAQRSVFFRGTLPELPVVRTESAVPPPVSFPARSAGAPRRDADTP